MNRSCRIPEITLVGDTAICSGGYAVPPPVLAQLGAVEQWQWLFPGGVPESFVGKNPPPVYYATPGVYEQILIAGNSSGADTVSATVRVLALPSVSVVADTTVCSAGVVELPLRIESGVLLGVQPQGVATVTDTSLRVSVQSDSLRITLTAANELGCSTTASVVVRRLDPVAVASGPDSLCRGQSAVLSVQGGARVEWRDGSGALLSAERDFSPVPQSTTTYYATVFQGECSSADSVTVTVVSSEASAGADVQLCPGESTTLSGSGGESVEWRRLGSSEVLSTERTLSVSPVQTQRYELRTTRGGCEARDTVEVRVGGSLEVAATGPAGVCVGEVVELSATGAEEYDWYDSAGVLVHRGATKQETALASTRYRIEGRRGDCRGSAEVGYEVYPLPVPSVSVLSGCVGEPFSATATGAARYEWLRGGSVVGTDSVVSGIADEAGVVNFVLRSYSEEGCSVDTPVEITVAPLAELNLSVGSLTVLPGTPIGIPLTVDYDGAVPASFTSELRYDTRLFGLDSAEGAARVVSVRNQGLTQIVELRWDLVGTPSTAFVRGTALMTPQQSTPLDPVITSLPPCVSGAVASGTLALDDICYPFSVRLFAPLELRVAASSLGVQAGIVGGLGEHWHVVVTDAVGRVVSEAHRHRPEGEELVVDLPLGGSGVYFLRVVSERGMAATAGVSVVR